MASASSSLHMLKSASFPIYHSNFPGKSNSGKRVFSFKSFGHVIGSSRRHLETHKFRVVCAVKEGDTNQNNGKEPPESLFMKELKRRGMTPTSLLEGTNRSNLGVEDERKIGEEDRDFSKGNAVSTELDKSLSNQRERSMALNSEGLEGLVPRAKLLLTIGGTFFFGFWPLILITMAVFSALYLYFGSSFVHDASSTPVSAPQYIDPYALLEDERISQIAPSLK